MGVEFKFTDNSAAILEAMRQAQEKSLNEIGLQAVKYTQMRTPTNTGNLKNSFSHYVQSDTVIVGTPVEYGVYVEYGTGRYATNGQGRPGWWVYVADNTGGGKRKTNGERKIYTFEEAKRIMAILRRKGLDAHMTEGIKPYHMLERGIADHMEHFKQIIIDNLSGI